MPNKTITFGADLLPNSDLDFNLGDSTHKWKINGVIAGGTEGQVLKANQDGESSWQDEYKIKIIRLG